MKRLFLSLIFAIVSIISFGQTNINGLTKITSNYQTAVNISIAMFKFGSEEIDFKTNGLCYIKYRDFGSVGNMITIKYSLDGWNDGKDIIKNFENVIFARDNNESYAVLNSYGETILMLIPVLDKNKNYAFYIENKMMLLTD